MTDILVTNGYGARTQQPFVNVTVQSADWSVQMTPQEARDLALNLLQAAEAAVNDAFLIEFMRHQVRASESVTAGILEHYRQWRVDKQI